MALLKPVVICGGMLQNLQANDTLDISVSQLPFEIQQLLGVIGGGGGTGGTGGTGGGIGSGGGGGVGSGGGSVTDEDDDMGNLLINGGFDIWQRSGMDEWGLVASNPRTWADAEYGPDRWVVLTEAANEIVWPSVAFVYPAHCCIIGPTTTTQTGTAHGAGVLQIVEAETTRNSVVVSTSQSHTAVAKVTTQNNPVTAHICLLGWYDFESNFATRDIVGDWASTTYLPGGFFINNPNLNVVGFATKQIKPADGLVSLSTSAVTYGINNLMVFVWFDGLTNADQVTVSEAGLYRTPAPALWTPRPFGQEVELCQRYYEKSCPINTAPGTTLDSEGCVVNAYWFTNHQIAYRTRKRTTVAPTVYAEHSGNAGKISEYSPSGSTFIADRVTSVGISTPSGATLVSSGLTAGNTVKFSWSVDAEL